MTVPSTAHEIRLASRPEGFPTPENFDLAEVPVPTPGAGQLLVRTLVMSVDPYMRGRMNDAKSYVAPYEVGKALEGGAVGEVVLSNAPGFAVGDTVLHGLGWREYAVVDAEQAAKVDPQRAPLGAYLGVLGMPGLTAYAGLVDVAGLKEGDVVFVSGAAGAVGQVAGQVAKLRGASRVIGSAGTDAKVEYLIDELGFDAAFNYKDAPVAEQLAAAAPDGVDVFFDNVGGDHLEAAIASFTLHGRAALCGSISGYNATESTRPPGPRNLGLAVGKRLTLRGFLVWDHAHLRDQFEREVTAWIAEGRLRYRETITEGGLAKAPEAFLGMLRGENTGKALVTF
ncbi:NADP-dependent oxidoreductase [Actinosynnema sp. NPDC047251]|uniref:Putative NADP-dependent oxidoreductase n=1 Tax=Saccharothrix espanaensis (strain ATCC 51144 / DSM 44229 / JCM 9112 / NBRC 15066 / NRRL 15764) TaxID=1179773 RepID=K0JUJ9_SACES|nr:NADP-dependent oxidoreductase [Saccharothrix espanaensis]CCH27913.1 putative NADP-dependent oxidoreductase [Saccharothrix espanaensis DSM 44229]